MLIRPPRRDEAEAVHALIVARDVADIGRPDYTLRDVLDDWQRPELDLRRDVFVVEDGAGAIVGWADTDACGARVAVHPDHERRGVGTLLRGAVEARLALDDDAGLAGAVVGERWEDGVGYVPELAVAGRARGRGHGRALLLAVLDAFGAAGLTIAELSVAGANTPAMRLYESVGMAADFRSECWELLASP